MTDKTAPEVPPPVPVEGRTSEKTRARLSDLRPHPRNPRKISPARLVQLQRTLEAEPDLLEARPIIALPDGTVVAGNQRLAAAAALGWESIPVVYADLSPEEVTRWMLLDNRGFGEDDRDAVAQLLGELEAADSDLELTGYDPADLDAMLRELHRPAADPDDAPPLPVEAKSVLGEVYELGPHRLMCGDAFTDGSGFYADAGVGCVLADPPYGIDLNTDYRSMAPGAARFKTTRPSKSYRRVIGDDVPFDASPLTVVFEAVKEQFWFGANYYRRTLSDSDRDGSWLVWDKRNEATDVVYGSGFELVWSRQPHKQVLLRHFYSGAAGADVGNRLHPTQKPSSVLTDILERWAPETCVVADPFAGSGSTLIAAELRRRRCFAMEIDPAYCDVIRQRYADYVGRPELAP